MSYSMTDRLADHTGCSFVFSVLKNQQSILNSSRKIKGLKRLNIIMKSKQKWYAVMLLYSYSYQVQIFDVDVRDLIDNR